MTTGAIDRPFVFDIRCWRCSAPGLVHVGGSEWVPELGRMFPTENSAELRGLEGWRVIIAPSRAQPTICVECPECTKRSDDQFT